MQGRPWLCGLLLSSRCICMTHTSLLCCNSCIPATEAQMEEPQTSVQDQLQRDILAAEFVASLFWSAMSSFRHDTVLRPFPPAFLTGGEHKNIEEVRASFNSLPTLDRILEHPESASQRGLQLLQWVLNTRVFSVVYRPTSTFDEVVKQMEGSVPSVRPQFFFELCYSPESEERFQSTASSHGVFYAYHGSAVENFYSIMHNGLLSHFNKTAAFGEGTYLSTELGVCLNWSPGGALWPKSVLPHIASCVAVCEVVRHPDIISRVQTGGDPSLQQKVPEKYFIVSNNEWLRVKYILVFGKQKTRAPESWMMRHKFLLVIVLYLFFLISLGALRSKQFQQLYSKYVSKLPWK